MNSETLSSILDRITPYDPNSHSKELFLQVLNSHPDLKEMLEKQLAKDEQWLELSKKNTVCFILNYNGWKQTHINNHKNIVRLSLVGKEKTPTISLDLNS